MLGIAERVRNQAETEAGAGMAGLAFQDIARRMFGFELLIGPYAVAHYRLRHALRRSIGNSEQTASLPELPRLGVCLADTLTEPGAAAAVGPLGFVSDGIADERREAMPASSLMVTMSSFGPPDPLSQN